MLIKAGHPVEDLNVLIALRDIFSAFSKPLDPVSSQYGKPKGDSEGNSQADIRYGRICGPLNSCDVDPELVSSDQGFLWLSACCPSTGESVYKTVLMLRHVDAAIRP